MKSLILVLLVIILSVRERSCISPAEQLCANIIFGVKGNTLVSDGQLRMGRSSSLFERLSRAGYKSLVMAYDECVRASDGNRFKRLNHPVTLSDGKSGPLEDLFRQSLLARGLV